MTRLGTFALAALIAGGSGLALAIGDDAIEPAGDPRIASTDVREVCATDGLPGSAYSRSHRVVKRRGVPGHQLDHIISLALGGADVEANIQLQPLDGPWNAHDKDRLEIALAREVCRYHTMALHDAQDMLYHWREAYIEVFHEKPDSVRAEP